MQWSLVAAMGRNRVIGTDTGLPWHLPADLRRFRTLTTGKVVLLGRKTWDTIGKALPGRHWLVLSRQEIELPPGAIRVSSVEEADELAPKLAAEHGLSMFEAAVAGGAEVYRLMWPKVATLHLTWVEAEPQGGVVFPIEAREWESWELVTREPRPADEKNGLATTFETWRRLASLESRL